MSDLSALNRRTYYNDFIKPFKNYIKAEGDDIISLKKIKIALEKIEKNSEHEAIQKIFYNVGMESGMELKDFFKRLYQILLGQEQGPRFGSFVALYGIDKMIALIDNAIN